MDEHITLFLDRGPALVAMGRLLIAQAEYARALGLLERVLAVAEAAGRFGRVIEILGLQALAFQAQNDESAALQSALALAEPQGFVRTFVDAGQPMAALLQKALSRGIARSYTAHLLAAFPTRDTERRDQPSDGSASGRPTAVTSTLEPITARELQVLRLLAAGASNAEVARELVVEQSTVKTHLIHLYGKLGVHTRTQAVARARSCSSTDAGDHSGVVPSSSVSRHGCDAAPVIGLRAGSAAAPSTHWIALTTRSG